MGVGVVFVWGVVECGVWFGGVCGWGGGGGGEVGDGGGRWGVEGGRGGGMVWSKKQNATKPTDGRDFRKTKSRSSFLWIFGFN